LIFYEKEVDVDKALNNYLKITGVINNMNNYLKIKGIINNMFRPQKTLKSLGMKLYNTLAIPTLIYGSESRTTTARDTRRMTAAEMKYIRKTAGYTWTEYKTVTDYKRTKHNFSFG